MFDLSDFYLSQDVMLLIDDIKVSQSQIMELTNVTSPQLTRFYVLTQLK